MQVGLSNNAGGLITANTQDHLYLAQSASNCAAKARTCSITAAQTPNQCFVRGLLTVSNLPPGNVHLCRVLNNSITLTGCPNATQLFVKHRCRRPHGENMCHSLLADATAAANSQTLLTKPWTPKKPHRAHQAAVVSDNAVLLVVQHCLARPVEGTIDQQPAINDGKLMVHVGLQQHTQLSVSCCTGMPCRYQFLSVTSCAVRCTQ